MGKLTREEKLRTKLEAKRAEKRAKKAMLKTGLAPAAQDIDEPAPTQRKRRTYTTRQPERRKRLAQSPKPPGRRSKKQDVKPAVPPKEAILAYFFPNGSPFGGLIKLLLLSNDEANLYFGPKSISLKRANKSNSILHTVEIYNDKALIKGSFEGEMANGFSFGVNLQTMSQTSTHSLTKNDSYMLYFRDSNEVMYAAQRNNRTGSEGLNETKIMHKLVKEDPYKTREFEDAMVTVSCDYFCSECAQISTAKCPRVIIMSGELGLVIKGQTADGEDVKNAFFRSRMAPASVDISDALKSCTSTMRVSVKALKTFIQLRNVAPPKSNILISYPPGKSLLLRAPISDYGLLCSYLKDEFGTQNLNLHPKEK